MGFQISLLRFELNVLADRNLAFGVIVLVEGIIVLELAGEGLELRRFLLMHTDW